MKYKSMKIMFCIFYVSTLIGCATETQARDPYYLQGKYWPNVDIILKENGPPRIYEYIQSSTSVYSNGKDGVVENIDAENITSVVLYYSTVKVECVRNGEIRHTAIDESYVEKIESMLHAINMENAINRAQ